ncbi:uncharacterized protein LOC130562147 isoform X1 [Triplophysa rosa]|uniref:uncharacterized protein LOC130562147 isoform X1 n=2 Tax=Triplophysa rosa TaxID=992332 RepID=UPI0025460A08|nr:uncharacterized protein LOC130562147 isoform X1 [Triplophysa rosa]
MATKRSHKAMSDAEWVSRLRKFASTGVWPSDGNRPAPRQKKWHEIYQRIEKCPMQSRGQLTLLGAVQKCTCGFHTQKPTASSEQTQRVREQQPAAAAAQEQSEPQPQARPQPSPSRITPSLSMFTKPRFSGSHIAAAKPNLSAARRPSRVDDQPSAAVSSAPKPSTTVSTQDPGVPASVPRTTQDVTAPAESCSIVSVSNLIFFHFKGYEICILTVTAH